MKKFLLVLGVTVAVAMGLFFIDQYLTEVPSIVLILATIAAGNITAYFLFHAKQKK